MIPTQLTSALPRTERAVRPGFEVRGKVDSSAEIRLVVKLRGTEEPAEAALRLGLTPPLDRALPGRRELAARFGAPRARLAAVLRFAEARGLRVLRASAGARIAVLAGNARDVSRAFELELRLFGDGAGVAYRGHLGPVFVPHRLQRAVTAVAGFDDRPMVERRAPLLARPAGNAAFPLARCAGQRIAVLGDAASRGLEIVRTAAPDARFIRYDADGTEAGWLEAFTAAVHEPRRPSVLLVCGGYVETEGARLAWAPPVIDEIDRTLAEAALLGITVVAAADEGPVPFPASSRHVLACGTTAFTPGVTSARASAYFARPPWQASAGVPPLHCGDFAGRSVPDVASDCDPAAAAALWAGLIARIDERLATISLRRTVGYFTPLLYCGLGSSNAFASASWDPCTGWGNPDGTELLRALTGDQ